METGYPARLGFRGVSLRGGTTICRVAKKTKGDLMEGWVTEGEGELEGATKKGRETVESKHAVRPARRVIPLQRKFDFLITKKFGSFGFRKMAVLKIRSVNFAG